MPTALGSLGGETASVTGGSVVLGAFGGHFRTRTNMEGVTSETAQS